MNVSRGLFRAWILVSLLWVMAVVAFGYALFFDTFRHEKWSYVHRLRDGVSIKAIDWNQPLYQYIRSPKEETLVPEFDKISYTELDYWEKAQKEGRVTVGHYISRH